MSGSPLLEEVDLEAEQRNKDNQRALHGTDSLSDGHDNAAVSGGFEFDHPELDDDEETPLLSGSVLDDEAQEAVDSHHHRLARKPSTASQWDRENDHVHLPRWRRPSVFWLLPCFAVLAMGFGATVVPKLDLIIQLLCRDYMASTSHTPSTPFDNQSCAQIPDVAGMAARFSLYMNLLSGVPSSFMAPKLGALSDRYGRVKLICLGYFSSILSDCVMAYAARNVDTFPVDVILLVSAFDGLCGSFTTAMAISFAYASDCEPPSRRAVSFALFQGSLFVGIAVGPLISGYIVEIFGQLWLLFAITAVAVAVAALSLILVVPESLTKERQLKAREIYAAEIAQQVASVKDKGGAMFFGMETLFMTSRVFLPLKILWPTGPGTSGSLRRNLVFLAAVDTVLFGVGMGAVGVILIYVKNIFGWGTLETSKYVSIVNTTRVCCLFILLPAIVRIFRGPPTPEKPHKPTGSDNVDIWIIRLSVLFDISGYLGYIFARSGTMMILSGAIAATGSIGSPTINSALTKHIPPDKVGQLLGATGLLHGMARVFGPLIFNNIYAATVKTFPQAVWVVLTAGFSVAFILSCFIRPFIHYDEIEADYYDRQAESEAAARSADDE